MKKNQHERQVESSDEPMGIVISRGSRAEAAPKFWAYVWGPAPEEAIDASLESVSH
jgi:hypothetical protein